MAGRRLPLTPTEFEILATLASVPGLLFRRRELRAILWGRGDAVQPRTNNIGTHRRFLYVRTTMSLDDVLIEQVPGLILHRPAGPGVRRK